MLKELRALVTDTYYLAQLPVFMAHLGAAVKQDRTRYPLYALFRPVRVPTLLYAHVWRHPRVNSIEDLRLHLVRACKVTQQASKEGKRMRHLSRVVMCVHLLHTLGMHSRW
jgi:hypothetical protein